MNVHGASAIDAFDLEVYTANTDAVMSSWSDTRARVH
jgi:hypothetical protein